MAESHAQFLVIHLFTLYTFRIPLFLFIQITLYPLIIIVVLVFFSIVIIVCFHTNIVTIRSDEADKSLTSIEKGSTPTIHVSVSSVKDHI